MNYIDSLSSSKRKLTKSSMTNIYHRERSEAPARPFNLFGEAMSHLLEFGPRVQQLLFLFICIVLCDDNTVSMIIFCSVCTYTIIEYRRDRMEDA